MPTTRQREAYIKAQQQAEETIAIESTFNDWFSRLQTTQKQKAANLRGHKNPVVRISPLQQQSKPSSSAAGLGERSPNTMVSRCVAVTTAPRASPDGLVTDEEDVREAMLSSEEQWRRYLMDSHRTDLAILRQPRRR